MVCNRQHIPRTELKAGQALVLLTVWTQESKTFTPHRAESDTSHPAASSCHTAGLPPGPSPAASNTGVKPSRSQKAPCSPSDWSPSAKPVCSHLIANSTHRNKLAAVAVFMSGSEFPRRYSGTTAAPRLSPPRGLWLIYRNTDLNVPPLNQELLSDLIQCLLSSVIKWKRWLTHCFSHCLNV